MRRAAAAFLLCLTVALLMPARASALPPGTRVQLFMGGLNSPVDMAYVPNSHKLFFTENRSHGGRLMSPREVLALKPRPEYVMYE